MQTKTWTYLDRSDWGRGEWANEPDKMQWLDEATKLPCLIVRNRTGALCGYVGVAEGHSTFAQPYDEVNVDAHGGLTFASFCRPSGPNGDQGICHVVEEGENDRVWWLGFDCAHCWDVIPSMRRLGFDSNAWYKSIDYVKQEVQSLAAQLAVMGTSVKGASIINRGSDGQA